MIESDCEVIITILTKNVTYFADLDSLFDDIMTICLYFECICWSHVKRDGNFVAHHLTSFILFGVEQIKENIILNLSLNMYIWTSYLLFNIHQYLAS